jgi:D-3-phosphoglycerate dehydrogenase
VTVLVLDPRVPADALPDLEARFGGEIGGDDVTALVITPRTPIRRRELERLPALRVVATASIGYDHVDLETAAARGVWVCHVPDYCIDEVADHTLALLLALWRGVVFLDRDVRAGAWNPLGAGPLRTLRGSRVGVVGYGRIGSAVARRLLALGAEVWATDIAVTHDTIAAAGAVPVVLDELLAGCDAVSLHVPLAPSTLGLIGERELARMRPGAVLVNTARGPVVDFEALLAALESGHLSGAALDVLPTEPPPQPPTAARLVVTSHAAWYSPVSEQLAWQEALVAVRAALGGEVPPWAVAAPR